MDWVCVPLVDGLWSRLLTRPWLARHSELGYSTPMSMWMQVSAICPLVRRTHPVTLLYKMVDRPYLDTIEDALLRDLLVHQDFALRDMFRDIQTVAGMLSVDIVCAGGYASWRLERFVEASRGNDSLPRTMRTTTIGSTVDMSEFWTPRDIDFYTTEADSETVLLVVQEAYLTYIKRIFGDVIGNLCDFVPGGEVATASTTDDEHTEEGERCLRLLDTREPLIPSLPHAMHTYLRRRIASTLTEPWKRLTVQKVWTMSCSMRLLFEPSAVTVWRVDDHRGTRPRSSVESILTSGSLLSHTSMQLSVDDGEWRFIGSRSAIADTLSRTIRILNTNTYMELLRSIIGYLRRGFTFPCRVEVECDQCLAGAAFCLLRDDARPSPSPTQTVAG